RGCAWFHSQRQAVIVPSSLDVSKGVTECQRESHRVAAANSQSLYPRSRSGYPSATASRASDVLAASLARKRVFEQRRSKSLASRTSTCASATKATTSAFGSVRGAAPPYTGASKVARSSSSWRLEHLRSQTFRRLRSRSTRRASTLGSPCLRTLS